MVDFRLDPRSFGGDFPKADNRASPRHEQPLLTERNLAPGTPSRFLKPRGNHHRLVTQGVTDLSLPVPSFPTGSQRGH